MVGAIIAAPIPSRQSPAARILEILPMILPVVLDKGDILYPLYSADTVCKFHVGIFAEDLYRHLGVFAPHGLGFDCILDASQCPDDIVSGLGTHIVNHRNVHPAFSLQWENR